MSRPFPMSDEMRRRWRTWKYIAQAETATDSDYRPTARVLLMRGIMRYHHFPDKTTALTPSKRRTGNRWRADWDEKYGFLGQPGEEGTFRTDDYTGKKVYGSIRDFEYRGQIELPYVSTIEIQNAKDQNGIGTATVTLKNAEWVEQTSGLDIFHELVRGYFSPFYDGGDLNDSMVDAYGSLTDYTEVHDDPFTTGNQQTVILDANGKRISGLVLPNRHIDIFQGYGDEEQRTFTGLVDTVTIDDQNLQITLQCSDFGRVATEVTYMRPVIPPQCHPVAFADAFFARMQGPSKGWPDKWGAPSNTILVNDITDIAGHLLAWCGFQSFKSPRPGRIGGIALENLEVGQSDHNAVFEGENFDKGSYLIDGINRIKELLGYMLYITPEFDPQSPMADRFRDHTVYDEEYSRYCIGMPHFEPPNIFTIQGDSSNDPDATMVEQFVTDEALTGGSLIYSNDDIRKLMYVANSGAQKRNGDSETLGFSAPGELTAGIPKTIFYNVQEEMGNVRLTREESAMFMWMTMIQTFIEFCKGSFTIAGYPGAKLNDQCDIFDRETGTWRRFVITGVSSSMTLGPNARYSTTLTVANIDNIYIRRIKEHIYKLGGFRAAIGWAGTIRETAVPA